MLLLLSLCMCMSLPSGQVLTSGITGSEYTYCKMCYVDKLALRRLCWASSQDGGVGRHTVPPHTTKRRMTTI